MAFSPIETACIVLAIAVLGYLALVILRALVGLVLGRKPQQAQHRSFQVGDITLLELEKYDGRDRFMPILLAIRGTVYDVTPAKTFYGPGGGYSVFAGREVARALGKMSITVDACNDDTSDFTEKEHTTLQEWVDKFDAKYQKVGKVIPTLDLTLEELAAFDGVKQVQPIYLAIKGTIFDVTRGSQFYGPNGPYPFAGRECARALAKFSTEVEDCNENLADCTPSELDALRDWQAQFYGKYPVMGHVKPPQSTAAAAE